jgi:diketogulonate reductase-like aldo/keto reductase
MKTKSGTSLSRIGIGTWGVGGRGHRPNDLFDVTKNDFEYIDALVYQLQNGINFTEVSVAYGHGNSIRLLYEAVVASELKREDLFITHSFYESDLKDMSTIEKDLESFYEVMQTDYADSTLVTQTIILNFGRKQVYALLHNLLNTGKTRYVSLSNAGKDMIQEFKQEFGDKFYAHEGHLSFEIRLLQDEGILDLCDDMNIKNIIWRPLRKGQTGNKDWPLLQEMSSKYGKTTNQIILNWMIHLNYAPMVFSTNRKHIDENIESTMFTMEDEDYQKLTLARPTEIEPSSIDWNGDNLGAEIVSLANNLTR